MEITTSEERYEDGNRATTVSRDGEPVVIVTLGDGETEEQYAVAVAEAVRSAEARE